MKHSHDHTSLDLSTNKSGYSDDKLKDIHVQSLREREKPTKGFPLLPIFMLFLFSILVFGCGIYIALYSGGFDPLIYNEQLKPVKKLELTNSTVPFDYITHGKKIYNRDCVVCHQSTGLGVPGVFPPLSGSKWVTGNVHLCVNIILSGLMGPIEVGGTVYNSVMPPLGSQLTDRDIAGVLSFIRQEWENNAVEVSEDFISKLREEQGLRDTPWTIEELLSLYPEE